MNSKRSRHVGQLAVIEKSKFTETIGKLTNVKVVPAETLEVLPPLMTEAEALQVIGEINSSLNRIRLLLVELEERQGYAALKFENMSQLMQSDLFSKARSTLQKELQAGRIERHYLNVPIGTLPETHFRPLTKLKPDYYKVAIEQASMLAGDRPLTARQVSQAVAELLRSEPEAPKKGIVEQLRERNSTSIIPCQPGDVVLIDCDRSIKEPYTQYNGCWVLVKERLTHGCKVQLMGKDFCVIWIDLKEIDLVNETLESVAVRIGALLQQEDLDEMEREILEGYHRRQWFTDWQLNLLATIEKVRDGGKK